MQTYNPKQYFNFCFVGAYVNTNWGWSFMLPGLIIAFFGVVNWFFMVPNPEFVGISSETVSNLYYISNYVKYCFYTLCKIVFEKFFVDLC